MEARVGGLTGQQLCLLRELQEEQRCAFVFFDRDPKGPEERCIEEPVEDSRFCEDHTPEPDYDAILKDRDYE